MLCEMFTVKQITVKQITESLICWERGKPLAFRRVTDSTKYSAQTESVPDNKNSNWMGNDITNWKVNVPNNNWHSKPEIKNHEARKSKDLLIPE